ncbi:pyruvate dehydrogenase (acetyl-transferring) E1 component subunit alpha [Frankia sp. CNm7]|uniref:Pyruvate dehydrogenase (Acetyl-transferring) E1 component subunit alpha n=2 Tax=Frankia nepalensis TaxID=1836974 RepID=A0A937RD88_9ACTN|nr:pyruvate dehydrogenase (acetyl-transferring) E1 component subunit alpha [Frankia nepalensis]MBL7515947.1 pyruvate dehydrogenase (acetyl-transferring) E1 component subunit alpha [Frankia nepalensis]MBL7519466.1 pyruvate dehydrogenase (acetyl-transferring) E1 component subunit alpha [Frankia nepalensis]MBL7627762.1 pyruvate dehydrogenase (acetyl-transferring) E1 component subunit alpha [Frankia nepalensis]
MQLLTPSGRRVTAATERESAMEAHVADVDMADLLAMYTDMVIVRRLDEEATALQRQGELGLWAPLRGQEAAQVGSARALAPDDMAFPSYREHGVAYCRGVDPVAVLSLFRGVTHGGWDPTEHGFALYAIVVGSQTLHATGYAMGVSRDGGGCATIAYFGDGASSQGDVSEAFGWAAVFGAPVVFFCQNNQYAISEPTIRQSRVPLCQRAAGYGFPGVRVDGNDVLATLAATRWALARARAGEGPTLLEAVTYRMGAHTTADDPTRYRDSDEVASWAERDPLARLRAYLAAQGTLDGAAEAGIAARADEFAADLRRRCLALPDPAPLSMFDHVHVDESGHVAAERADLAELLAAEDDPPPTAPEPSPAVLPASSPRAVSSPSAAAPPSAASSPPPAAPSSPAPSPGSSAPGSPLAVGLVPAGRPVAAPPPQSPGPEASCPR